MSLLSIFLFFLTFECNFKRKFSWTSSGQFFTGRSIQFIRNTGGRKEQRTLNSLNMTRSNVCGKAVHARIKTISCLEMPCTEQNVDLEKRNFSWWWRSFQYIILIILFVFRYLNNCKTIISRFTFWTLVVWTVKRIETLNLFDSDFSFVSTVLLYCGICIHIQWMIYCRRCCVMHTFTNTAKMTTIVHFRLCRLHVRINDIEEFSKNKKS